MLPKRNGNADVYIFSSHEKRGKERNIYFLRSPSFYKRVARVGEEYVILSFLKQVARSSRTFSKMYYIPNPSGTESNIYSFVLKTPSS